MGVVVGTAEGVAVKAGVVGNGEAAIEGGGDKVGIRVGVLVACIGGKRGEGVTVGGL